MKIFEAFKELLDSIDKKSDHLFNDLFKDRGYPVKVQNIVKSIALHAIEHREIRKINQETLKERLKDNLIKIEYNFTDETFEELRKIMFNILRHSVEENADEVNRLYAAVQNGN